MDKTNKEWRYVLTRDGKGLLVGLDDKDNPREGCVQYGDSFRCYPVDEIEEVEE